MPQDLAAAGEPGAGLWVGFGVSIACAVFMAVGSVAMFLLRGYHPLTKRPTFICAMFNVTLVLDTLCGSVVYMQLLSCLIAVFVSDLLLTGVSCFFILNVIDTYLIWRLNLIKSAQSLALQSAGAPEFTTSPSARSSRAPVPAPLIARLQRWHLLTRPLWSTLIVGVHLVVAAVLSSALKWFLDHDLLLEKLFNLRDPRTCFWNYRVLFLALLLFECSVFGATLVFKFLRHLRGQRDTIGLRLGIYGFLFSCLARWLLWLLLSSILFRYDNGTYTRPITIISASLITVVGFIFFSGVPTWFALKTWWSARKAAVASGHNDFWSRLLARIQWRRQGEPGHPLLPFSLFGRHGWALRRSNRVSNHSSLPFDYFIESKEGSRCFYGFLMSEFNAENLLFLLDERLYRATPLEVDRRLLAGRLSDAYLQPQSLNLLNISGNLSDSVRELVDRVQAGKQEASVDLFAKVQAEIRRVLLMDCWPRFVVTKAYNEHTASRQEHHVHLPVELLCESDFNTG